MGDRFVYHTADMTTYLRRMYGINMQPPLAKPYTSPDEARALSELRRLRSIHSDLVEARQTASTIGFVPGNGTRDLIDEALHACRTVLLGSIFTIRTERKRHG